GEGGGDGERPLFLLFRPLSPAFLRSGWAWARPGTAARPGGRGQRVKPPPRPAQTSATVCSPSPHPSRHPTGASSRPGSALRTPPAPPRQEESASLRRSVLPPARRAVAAVAAALGKWRPSSFSLPPL
uniref:Uncharacterized protein LOC109684814 n=1 Tax=Castor canadensis TaxID=51338 RepID=A0A8B7UG50_CASCN